MRSVDRQFLHAVLTDPFDEVLALALIAEGADINHMPDLDDELSGGDKNATPLMLASSGGHKAGVTFLLKQPAIDLTKTTEEENLNALMFTYIEEPSGLLDIAALLINAGVDLSHRDSKDWCIEDYEEKLRWKDASIGGQLKEVRESFLLGVSAENIAKNCVNAIAPVHVISRKLKPRVMM